MATKIIMPQLGESVVEGTVTRWLRKEGETIVEFDSLLEVTTDKVETEIPSPATGTLLKILVPADTTVRAGTVLAWVGEPGEALDESAAPQAAPAAQAAPTAQTAPIQPQPAAGRDLGFISPVVAKMAAEYQVELSRVKGTGEGGRITKKDVLAYVSTPPPAAPAAEQAAWETPGEGDLFRPTEMMFTDGAPGTAAPAAAPVPVNTPPAAPKPAAQAGDRLIPLNNMRRAIAERMVLSKTAIPHVTTVMEVDMSRVTAHRAANKEQFASAGVNLTFTAYFVAAVSAALKAFPLVNSSWTDEGILVHAAHNIGLAASLGEEGLIVPVVKGVDGLSLLGIARAVNDLAERARNRSLQPDEVKGGTFTITNHGVGGSLFATPIINYPQCAILGVGIIKKRPVVLEGDAIAIRPMLYLTLTFDHRILDGTGGDGFLARVVEYLEKTW